MPVHLAESPLTCVAVGSGRSLEEFEAIHRSQAQRRRNNHRRVGDSRPAALSPTLGSFSCSTGTAAHGLRSWVPRSSLRPTGSSSRSATAVKRRLVAGVLVLLSLVLITVYFREPASGGLHSVQSTGATVLRPFEVGANRIAAPVPRHLQLVRGADRREVRERAPACTNRPAARGGDPERERSPAVGRPSPASEVRRPAAFPEGLQLRRHRRDLRSADRVSAAGRNRGRLEQRDPRQRPGRDRRRPRRQDQLRGGPHRRSDAPDGLGDRTSRRSTSSRRRRASSITARARPR